MFLLVLLPLFARFSNYLIYLLSWSDLRINENIFLRTLFIFQAFTNPKQPTSSMLLVSKSEAGPMGLTRATAQALSSDPPLPPPPCSLLAAPPLLTCSWQHRLLSFPHDADVQVWLAMIDMVVPALLPLTAGKPYLSLPSFILQGKG